MLILKDEFQEMLRIVSTSSVEGIGFTDSLGKALNGHSLKELSDEGQRQLIQAWLYPTNDNGEIDSFDEAIAQSESDKQWYRDRATSFSFSIFGSRCSMCECESPCYVGITNVGTMFEFCRNCRNELQRAKDTALAPQERIGA